MAADDLSSIQLYYLQQLRQKMPNKIISYTPKIRALIERLSETKIYEYEFMRSLKRLDSMENRLVSKSLGVNSYLFSEISSRFAKVRVAFEFKIFWYKIFPLISLYW